MRKWTEYGPCAFCNGNEYEVEEWDAQGNLYLLSCTNANTSAAMWCEWHNGRWRQVEVQRPRQSAIPLSDIRYIPVTQRALRPDGSVAVGREAQRINDVRKRSQEMAAKRAHT